MKINQFIRKVNEYSNEGIPFIFIIDFELNKPRVLTLEEAKKKRVFFDLKGHTNFEYYKSNLDIENFDLEPISKKKYFKAFEITVQNINLGNSYLLNLTFPTKIKTKKTLVEIFNIAKAQYKLLYKKKFLVFSPECFIRIKNDFIYSYPMKGTIDAAIPNAESEILNNKKEIYEHNTIVDLIRNDISMVSTNVNVTKFRYINKIKTNKKELLQVSSEIKGKLPNNWRSTLGDILIKLLPAGSISGAPKQKTVEIIKEAEKHKRGYYTGIYGIFDGKNLDSAVNIRFLEKNKNGLFYHSGGGITAKSDKEVEYNELIDKVYVPTT